MRMLREKAASLAPSFIDHPAEERIQPKRSLQPDDHQGLQPEEIDKGFYFALDKCISIAKPTPASLSYT